MLLFVAARAQRDQVFLYIAAELTAMLLMMDVKVGTRTAMLAAPTIALQYLLPQLIVLVGRQSQSTGLRKAHPSPNFRSKREVAVAARKVRSLPADAWP